MFDKQFKVRTDWLDCGDAQPIYLDLVADIQKWVAGKPLEFVIQELK